MIASTAMFARHSTTFLPNAIVFSFGTLLVLVLVLHHHRRVRERDISNEADPVNAIEIDRADPLLAILAVIARNYSQELPTTPRTIAAEIKMNEDIVLAFMWKYHNEQYMTFRSGGAAPTVNTSFFLSPKAWDCIKVAKR